MAKKETDASKIENKFKLSLLNVEKRFVDLETAISEIGDRVKEDITPIPDLQQRVEDIEDLIMVEQAGIMELKKMLEEMQANPANVDTSALEKKIADLEGKISSVNESADVKSITEQVTGLKQQIDQKIKELESTKVEVKPDIDLEVLNTKYDGLKSRLDDIINKKVEIDLKIEEMQKSIGIVENKLGVLSSETFAEEIQHNKKKVIVVLAKIGSIERVIANMTADVQQIQNTLGKIESFEKLTLLGKDIESKIERFKLIEDEISRLSARVELLYSNMDKRLDSITKTEKKIPEILEYVTRLERELDRSKIEILDRVKKEDVKNVLKGLEKMQDDLERIKSGDIEIDKAVKEDMAKLAEEMERKYEELIRKSGKVDVVKKKELEDSILRLQKEFSNKIDAAQLKDFARKSDLQVIYKMKSDLDNKFNELNRKVAKVNIDEVLKLMQVIKDDVNAKLKPFEQKEDSLMNDTIKKIDYVADELDFKINDLVDKFAYLETRMAAIEKMMMHVRAQPIILE